MDQALRIAPRNDIAWGNKGDALYSLERFEQAVECYNRAIDIDPRVSWYLTNKGGALLELNKYNESLISLNDALAADPEEEYALYFKSKALIHINKMDEAIKCYNELRKLNSELAENLINDGLLINNKKTNKNEKIVKDKQELTHNSEHDKIQWLILNIGNEMDFDVWVAKK